MGNKDKLLKELQIELYQSAKQFTACREEKQKTISKLRTVYTAAAKSRAEHLSKRRHTDPIEVVKMKDVQFVKTLLKNDLQHL